jgi:alpha-D-ribose 1-methylphosphonate 5-triphosphate synthase subunit PhnH
MLADRPGFADPVHGAQACFRAVLDAMARPGVIYSAGLGLDPPPPLCPSAGALLLTLIDHDSKLWIDEGANAARDWIAFHCGAIFADRSAAAFLFALDLPPLDALCQGSDEAPERSATVIVQLARLGEGRRYRLSGPGLRAPAVFAADGLPAAFAAAWSANHALYPRGIDLILCAGTDLAALPRSVAVEAL